MRYADTVGYHGDQPHNISPYRDYVIDAFNGNLPYHQKMADDITVIRSMVTEQINHDPAHTFMNTGTAISGRPSMGAWVNYGLGSETENLPGFVVLTSVGGRNPQPIASRQWASGFLPSRFQGVEFNSTGDPVHYVSSPPGVARPHQDALIRTIQNLDSQRNALLDNPEIAARISAYEMAFRMQTSVPELTDLSGESKNTWASAAISPTSRPGPCLPISRIAACSKTPSWCGAVNSAAPPCSRAREAPVATTTSRASPCEWPAAA